MIPFGQYVALHLIHVDDEGLMIVANSSFTLLTSAHMIGWARQLDFSSQKWKLRHSLKYMYASSMVWVRGVQCSAPAELSIVGAPMWHIVAL